MTTLTSQPVRPVATTIPVTACNSHQVPYTRRLIAGPFVWSSALARCLPGGIEWDPVEDNPIAGDLPIFDREPFGREGTRHWRRVSVVHQQGCFAVSEGGDDISLGEDLQEGCPERSILLNPLDAPRRCFAYD